VQPAPGSPGEPPPVYAGRMPDTSTEPIVLLYPFRFVDPLTGKWVRARYRATREELDQRYAQWEITGEPEVCKGEAGSFNPYR